MKIELALKKVVWILIVFFSLTLLSSLAYAEKHYYGDSGIPADYSKTILDMKKIKLYQEKMAILPDKFNWKDLGMVTPAKNQGSCGSCWAFASVGAMESHVLINKIGTYNLSEQEQVSCNTNMHGCTSGGMTALHFWEKAGPMTESCTGYCACDEKCSSCSNCSALPYYLEGYYTVDTSQRDNIKASIQTDGPGYFRFNVYADFNTFWDKGKSGDVYVQTTGSYSGGHAVLIIGWDDAKNAWFCKNSWGEKAGPNGDGTFWMAYDGHAHDLAFGMANFTNIKFREIQKIACVDNAGFNLSFKIAYRDKDGNEKESSKSSDNYPSTNWRTINLSGFDSNIPEGTLVWPRINASGGKTNDGDARFKYTNNGEVATYMVYGATQNYSVNESGGLGVNPPPSSVSALSVSGNAANKEVQKISCSNDAAFVMDFKIGYKDKEGKEKESKTNSGSYPIDQWRTIDLSNLDPAIDEGTEVWVKAHASGGTTNNGNTKLVYRKNNQVASYVVKGTTLIFSVKDTENNP